MGVLLPEMLCSCKGLPMLVRCLVPPWDMSGPRLHTFGGLHISQMCTGTPFLALLTRPVMGVYLTGVPDVVALDMGLIGL